MQIIIFISCIYELIVVNSLIAITTILHYTTDVSIV
jgi:hypothetical protein